MERLSSVQIHEYKYDSKEEREEHVKEMESLGYEVYFKEKNRDNYYNPKSKDYWYGKFYKYGL